MKLLKRLAVYIISLFAVPTFIVIMALLFGIATVFLTFLPAILLICPQTISLSINGSKTNAKEFFGL